MWDVLDGFGERASRGEVAMPWRSTGCEVTDCGEKSCEGSERRVVLQNAECIIFAILCGPYLIHD